MERLTRYPATPLRRFAGWLIVVNLLVDGALLGAAWQNLALSRAAGQCLAPWTAQGFADGLSRDIAADLGLVAVVVAVLAALSLHLYRAHRAERQARDLTARVAREQDLLLRNELVGMARLKDRRTTWTNDALARLFGYGPGELLDTPARLLYLDDESCQAVGEAAYPVLRAGGRFRAQLRMRRKDGRPMWVDLSGTAVSADESLWMLVDIDALKYSEEDARRLSRCDPLTGLPNRRGLEAWLADMAPRRPSSHVLAVAYLDLDGFKPVNDSLGHDAGDDVLRVVGSRLSSALREGDLAVRLGGDEFALTLTNVASEQEAMAVLRRLRETIGGPIRLDDGQVVRIDVSIGLAMGRAADALSLLLHRADEALCAAKRAGKGQVRTWTPTMAGAGAGAEAGAGAGRTAGLA